MKATTFLFVIIFSVFVTTAMGTVVYPCATPTFNWNEFFGVGIAALVSGLGLKFMVWKFGWQ